jgi:hypothetical protein
MHPSGLAASNTGRTGFDVRIWLNPRPIFNERRATTETVTVNNLHDIAF